MNLKTTSLVISVIVIALSLIIATTSIAALALDLNKISSNNNDIGKITDTNSHRSSGGAVPLIPINTGDTKLDKDIGKFYSCIKKTGHTGGTKPEPSRDEVDNCYFRIFTDGDNSNGITSSNSNSIS
jgi:hypothetical protein